MKVIGNQFRSIFLKIISQEQTRFIVGRSIIDNVNIAQEVLHSMKTKKTPQLIVVKIDLKKAQDRVRWDFIKALLKVEGIPIFFNTCYYECYIIIYLAGFVEWCPNFQIEGCQGYSSRMSLIFYIYLSYLQSGWGTVFIRLSHQESRTLFGYRVEVLIYQNYSSQMIQ